MKAPRLVSRRSFVGQVSVGGTALALGARLRGAAAPAPRKLGVALVGLGGYASNLLAPALQQTQHCELRAVVTGSHEKGLRWAKVFGFPEKNIYNYETMGRLADNPDIDIVYVVTPNALHPQHVIAAAKAGKHVITEKPMANSVAECDAMIAACAAAKVKLSVGYRLQFEPHYNELKRQARDPAIGPFTKLAGGYGFTMTQPQWRAEKKLAGGGPLMDLGIYPLQAACMAAGEVAPVAVTAKERPKERPEFFRDVEETLDWAMEYASGARAECVTSYNGGADFFRAESPRGTIEFGPAFAYTGIQTRTPRGPLEIAAPLSQQAVQMDDFALCVREGRESKVSGAMGRRDLVIIEAIYESARNGGKRVEVKV